MKVIIVLFGVVFMVLSETVVENVENSKSGDEVISEKVITETTNLSSGGSAAAEHSKAIQKMEDEKILEDIYGKKILSKGKISGEQIEGTALLVDQGGKGKHANFELNAQHGINRGNVFESSHVVGDLVNDPRKDSSAKAESYMTAAVSSDAEKKLTSNFHLNADDHLKKPDQVDSVKQVHHQVAPIPHFPAGLHEQTNLHGAKIIEGNSQQIQQVSEVRTTKIIQEEQVTNHQISSQHLGHKQINPTGIHRDVITEKIIHPHSAKIIHQHSNHPMIGHNKLPVHSTPIIVQPPHQESLHQLAAIRLINQQLQEAMIQNQQAALVGLQIQCELEMKNKQNKLMANRQHHIPHHPPMHESYLNGHEMLLMNHRDNHQPHHYHHHHQGIDVPVGIQYTSFNKHELPKMRNLAKESQSSDILYGTEHSGKAALAKESMIESEVKDKIVVSGENIKKQAGIPSVVQIGMHGNLEGSHQFLKEKEISSDLLNSKTIGLKKPKGDLIGNVLAEDTIVNQNKILQKNMPGLEHEAVAGKLMEKDAEKVLKLGGGSIARDGMTENADMSAMGSIKQIDIAKKAGEAIETQTKPKETDKQIKEMETLKKSENIIAKEIDKTLKNTDVAAVSSKILAVDDATTGQPLKDVATVKEIDTTGARRAKEIETIKKSAIEGTILNGADIELDKSVQLGVKNSEEAPLTKPRSNLMKAKDILSTGTSIKKNDEIKKSEGFLVEDSILKTATEDKLLKDEGNDKKIDRVVSEKVNDFLVGDAILKTTVKDTLPKEEDKMKKMDNEAIKNSNDFLIEDAVINIATKNTLAKVEDNAKKIESVASEKQNDFLVEDVVIKTAAKDSFPNEQGSVKIINNVPSEKSDDFLVGDAILQTAAKDTLQKEVDNVQNLENKAGKNIVVKETEKSLKVLDNSKNIEGIETYDLIKKGGNIAVVQSGKDIGISDAVLKQSDKATRGDSGKLEVEMKKEKKNSDTGEKTQDVKAIDEIDKKERNAIVLSLGSKSILPESTVITGKYNENDGFSVSVENKATDNKPVNTDLNEKSLKVDTVEKEVKQPKIDTGLDKILVLTENPKKAPVEEDINERSKVDDDIGELETNMKNTKRKDEEKKIDILQKNIVDERMGTTIGGAGSSKNEPIFTLKEGNEAQVDSDKLKVNGGE